MRGRSASLATAVLVAAASVLAAKTKELEVVVKGKDKERPSVEKPVLDIPFDAYETARPMIEPDDSLLLAESPVIAAWKGDGPVTLRNEHLLQPWNDILMGEVDTFRLRFKADYEAQNSPLKARDAKKMSWTLSIVNEDGRLFQRFTGKGAPPEMLPWNGRSDDGRWLAPGHDYSAVYVFSFPDQPPQTVLGQPLRYPVFSHQDQRSLLIGLDSGMLFGPQRDQEELGDEGRGLLRVAADVLRRKAYGLPFQLRLYAPDAKLARRQAKLAKDYLATELFMPAEDISISVVAASAAESRLDLVVKSR